MVYYLAKKLYKEHLIMEKNSCAFDGIQNDLKRVSMGWWYLRLSAKILALLRLSANFFCFKKLNIN